MNLDDAVRAAAEWADSHFSRENMPSELQALVIAVGMRDANGYTPREVEKLSPYQG